MINNYRNARFAGGRNGVTSINAGDFGRGRSINRNNFVRASNNDLARAGEVQGRLPFTGSVDGRRMSDRPVNTQSLPRVNANTRFAQRSSPATQTRPAQSFGQAPVGQNSVGQNPVGQNQGQRPNNNWQRFDRGTRGAAPNAPQQNAPQVNRGGNSAPIGNGGNTGGNWRRMEGGGQNAPQVIGGGRNYNERGQPAPVQTAPPQGQFRQSAPQPREQYIPRQQQAPQPVRINPPMVRERAPSPQPAPQVSRPEPSRGGGFGQPRPQSGGGGGGGQSHGNGGGGGNRGDGGGHKR